MRKGFLMKYPRGVGMLYTVRSWLLNLSFKQPTWDSSNINLIFLMRLEAKTGPSDSCQTAVAQQCHAQEMIAYRFISIKQISNTTNIPPNICNMCICIYVFFIHVQTMRGKNNTTHLSSTLNIYILRFIHYKYKYINHIYIYYILRDLYLLKYITLHM